MFRKVAPLVVAPLVLVTACAREAEPGAIAVTTGEAAVSALRSAPDAATDAGTAQFEMVIAVTPEASDEPFEITATGAVDPAARQMSMTMDMGALAEQLAASSDAPVPEGFGGAWDIRVDGDTFYLRVPLLQVFTGEEGWLSMTTDDIGATAGGLGLGAGTYDPSQMIDWLRGVSGNVDVVGGEEVRGVETTRYRATIDLARAVAEAPEAQRAQLEAALEQVGDAGTADIPVDIWLDADELPRRIAMELGEVPAGISGADAAMTLTLDVFGYGEPVEIDLPSGDEVTPFRDVAGNLGAGS